MSEITIKTVSSKKDMKKFIEFNYKLYKNNPYAVPDLYFDMMDNFNPKKNPGYEFSDVELYLAYKGDEVVGRVVAIINNRANETWNTKKVRFGWIDFIDDIEVSKALIGAVEKFGLEHGMTEIEGPMGITDMDKEGMLVYGFDRIGTMNTLYNYPYYPEHLKQLGFEKETEWLELRMKVPEEVPEKYHRVTQLAMQRYNVQIKKFKSSKDLLKANYGQKIFDLINESYSVLFGYSKMTQKQIDKYVNTFLPLVDLRMVTLVETTDTHELVGVGASMPSLVYALQKSGGKLLPFGWYHLLKALKWKHSDGVELLLIAVRPDYQRSGISAILFDDLIPVYNEMNFKWAETNCILEDNVANLSQWTYLNPEIVKRRRCFKKAL